MNHNITTLPTKPVELWYSHCGAASATALALEHGLLQAEFAQGGTILHALRDGAASVEQRNAHYHHGRSGLFREGGNIPPIWARSNGADTAVIGITWVDEYQGILARAGSAIRSIGDLANKRLGLPLHSHALIDFQRGAARRGFSTALTLAGLSPDDARFVHIQMPAGGGQDTVLRALESGYVDAVFVRFEAGQRAAQDPRFHEVININDQPDPLVRVNNGTPRPVTVDRAFLQRHPDLAARYLAVLLRAGQRHGCVPSLSDLHLAALEQQKNFLLRERFIKSDFDVKSWIAPEPLAAALHQHPLQQAA